MRMEAFREHLEHPVGRGLIDGSVGVAGGSLCGDLATIAVRVEDGRVRVGWEASGCGATSAACSAVAALAATDVLSAARISPTAISARAGGLSPGKLHAAELAADAFHSALGRGGPGGGAAGGRRRVSLVAMSGGVDSAVAALLVGEEAFGVTVELWRDPDNDAEASCCSASAVRAARAVAHGLGHAALHPRPARRSSGPGVVDPWLADHAAGLTPNPCVRCNGHVRLDAMLDFADRLGADTLATGHYARVTEEGRLRGGVDPAKDQAYMLAATAPETIARLRFPLGELDEAARARAGRRGAAARREQGRVPGPVLPRRRRPGGLPAPSTATPRTPGDLVTRERRGGRPARRPDGFTVGQRKGIGVGRRGAALRARQDAGRRRQSARASGSRRREVALPRRGPARARARRGPAALPRRALPAAASTATRLRARRAVHGAAPGQVAVLYSGDAVVGHGVIDR